MLSCVGNVISPVAHRFVGIFSCSIANVCRHGSGRVSKVYKGVQRLEVSVQHHYSIYVSMWEIVISKFDAIKIFKHQNFHRFIFVRWGIIWNLWKVALIQTFSLYSVCCRLLASAVEVAAMKSNLDVGHLTTSTTSSSCLSFWAFVSLFLFTVSPSPLSIDSTQLYPCEPKHHQARWSWAISYRSSSNLQSFRLLITKSIHLWPFTFLRPPAGAHTNNFLGSDCHPYKQCVPAAWFCTKPGLIETSFVG